jgi:cytochrome P450/NADPH-cytochrome P450 reductase
MGYRFNSFYKDELHPFVQSMSDALVELGKRSERPKWASIFYRYSERKLHKVIALMRGTSDELIKSWKADSDGGSRKDLLTAMIEGVDPKTGAKLSEESITNNLVTFLVAGHETTSGTLSFAFYSMLKTPHAYQQAQKEVDSVMGRDPITLDKLFKLKYIPAVSKKGKKEKEEKNPRFLFVVRLLFPSLFFFPLFLRWQLYRYTHLPWQLVNLAAW